MDDVFMEKIVARKKTGVDMLIIAGVLLVSFAAIIAVPIIPYINSMWLLAIALIGFAAFNLIRSRNIEFEYIVTNGDLDIDKIIAQRKRKRVFSGSCKNFDIVAKVKSEYFNQDVQSIKTRIDAASSINSEDAYFFTLNYKTQRTLVIFEPNERMLKSFKTFIPRKIFN
jgi:hypothetical protein